MQVHPPPAAARLALLSGSAQPSHSAQPFHHKVASGQARRERWLIMKKWDTKQQTLSTIRGHMKTQRGFEKAMKLHPPPAAEETALPTIDLIGEVAILSITTTGHIM